MDNRKSIRILSAVIAVVVVRAFLSLCTLALTGCALSYYSPPAQTVPLLSERGEIEVGGSAALEWSSSSVNIQMAGAVTNHLAFAADAAASQHTGHNHENNDDYVGRSQFLEVGPGAYFSFLGGMVFEVYAFAGYGRYEVEVENSDPGFEGISADAFRFTLQPVLGWKMSRFEAALSSRIGALTYRNVHGNARDAEGNEARSDIYDGRRMFLVEPALTVRGGTDDAGIMKPFKVQVQVGTSHNLSEPDFRQKDTWYTIGILYRFAPR